MKRAGPDRTMSRKNLNQNAQDLVRGLVTCEHLQYLVSSAVQLFHPHALFYLGLQLRGACLNAVFERTPLLSKLDLNLHTMCGLQAHLPLQPSHAEDRAQQKQRCCGVHSFNPQVDSVDSLC